MLSGPTNTQTPSQRAGDRASSPGLRLSIGSETGRSGTPWWSLAWRSHRLCLRWWPVVLGLALNFRQPLLSSPLSHGAGRHCAWLPRWRRVVQDVLDTRLESEVLLLSLTRDVDIGEPLILTGPHRHPFELNMRDRGRRLTWIKNILSSS